ncbi:hypothetical protein L1S35_04295 [Flavobacterium sp. AS60]|uniref:YncE family protein n=1 Tax=Flavobacterium anseongense TaxID=2910677 RepID=UPI001F43B32D|nr:hypothetical protein [Flavobacterium sp. AS60]MCF6128880.1 hypothetical protein [Flavobacterium sp. AS60]
MKYWNLFLILVMLNATFSAAQTQSEIYNSSVKAYESKDYKTFLQLTRKLDSLRPFHPTYTYNLASAYALNDNTENALITLQKMVLMNNTIDFEKDDDFKSLKETEEFKSVVALKNTQNDVIATSNPIITLSEKELHPEGLTYLGKSKTWLASSIRKRKIVAFDIKTGQCRDWLIDNKMLAVLALKADSKEEFLWVATAAFPEMENFNKSMTGEAEVLKVSIKTKQIVNRFAIPGNHVFGDLILGNNDVVYVSDSGKPILYKIENDVLTEFVSFEKDGFNLQGLAFNNNQSKLFIADYLKGVAVIDMQTKTKTWLTFPKNIASKGIDGLVFYNNTLIAIQNGVKPIRITALKLNSEQNQISSFKILDNNRPEFDEPALATVVGGKVYFFANCPWKAYDKNGVLDVNKVSNPILFSCKLN